ncbi:MAG TPA: hypothetical protein VMB05_07545 [Solirubrobacteraceae bacterium]|nr:hypothetical protein [Solirubrobacteraceae bacterium]HUB74469.1 hypothetical protein [Solirubrobacteraceae bacterium]
MSDATPKTSPPEAISDELILAALWRAECHQGYQGAPDWAILEQLSLPSRTKKARQVKARLPELAQAGFISQSRRKGIGQWFLTPQARKHLDQTPEVMLSLPESPQHRRWRDARDAAEYEIEGFYLALRDAVDAATDLLSEPMPPGPSSDAWFELGERLHRACRRLGSASHCLYEWVEPPEDESDRDERREPSDAGLTPDERRRRESRRSGRRNPAWWHDSTSAL